MTNSAKLQMWATDAKPLSPLEYGLQHLIKEAEQPSDALQQRLEMGIEYFQAKLEAVPEVEMPQVTDVREVRNEAVRSYLEGCQYLLLAQGDAELIQRAALCFERGHAATRLVEQLLNDLAERHPWQPS